MSAESRDGRLNNPDLAELPEFELGFLFDESESPAEVTVYESGDHVTSRWITTTVSDAVELEDCL